MYEFSEDTRIGLIYRAQTDYDTDPDVNIKRYSLPDDVIDKIEAAIDTLDYSSICRNRPASDCFTSSTTAGRSPWTLSGSTFQNSVSPRFPLSARMNRLFNIGLELGASDEAWKTKPPGLEIETTE